MEETLQEYIDDFLDEGGSMMELLGELVDEGYLLSGVSGEPEPSGVVRLTSSPELAIVRATAVFKNGILTYNKKDHAILLELREDYKGKCNLELEHGYVNVFDGGGIEPVASMEVNCGDLSFPIRFREWEKPICIAYH
jgi:hypothetical protein